MTPIKVIERMFDEEVACDYCLVGNECPHGTVCYGGEPIEPACASGDTEVLIDYEEYCDENGIKLDESEGRDGDKKRNHDYSHDNR